MSRTFAISKLTLSTMAIVGIGAGAAWDANATTIPFGFFATKLDKLIFTTTAQSIYASNCSGVMTVKSVNAVGATKAVASSLTVSLAALSGVTYYSDSNCVTPVTSVTIASGASTASFYFVSTSTGTQTIAVTASGYAAGTQNETITANPYIWTGGGTDAKWTTAANWSGGSVPGASNVAVFDGTCSSNCNASIWSNTSVGGIRIASGYAGNVGQGVAATLTIGGAGYYQAAGTFTGASNSIIVNGPFGLVGGTFTSTSANLRVATGIFKVLNSPTFNHNNGKLELGTNNASIVSGVDSISFYNVDLLGWGSSDYVTLNGTLNVLGSLRFVDYGYLSSFIGSGTVNVSGDLTLQGAGWRTATSVLIKMIGTGTITGSGTGSDVGSLEIATSGTVTFASSGSVDIFGDFTYTSGTVVTTGSLVQFIGTTQNINPGSMSFNNVGFGFNGWTIRTLTGTMKVLGDLTLNCTNYSALANSGIIEVSGNLNIQGNRYFGGTTLIRMVGTGTITGSGSGSYIGPLEIATSGTITFANTGSVDIAGNFTYTSGTVVTTGSTVRFVSSVPSVVNAGSVIFNNVSFVQNTTSPNTITGTLYVAGNLALTSTGYNPSFNNGTIDVKGNISASGFMASGTTSLVLSGSGVQTLNVASGTVIPGSVITVNNSSSVLTLGSSVALGSSQGITVNAGSVDMAGFNLTTKTLTLNSNTLTKNGGTLTVNGTVAGTGSLYGGTVNP